MSNPVSPLRNLPLEATRVASGRIGRLALAYGAAVIATALIRTVGLVAEETWTTGFGRLIAANGWSSLAIVPAMTGLVGFVGAAPFATAFLVVAEGKGVRTRRAYVLAGLVVAILTQVLVTLPLGFPAPSLGLVLLDAVAGAVGGWVAWIVGVRSAPPPPVSPWNDL